MSEISQINIENNLYDVKDTTARQDIQGKQDQITINNKSGLNWWCIADTQGNQDRGLINTGIVDIKQSQTPGTIVISKASKYGTSDYVDTDVPIAGWDNLATTSDVSNENIAATSTASPLTDSADARVQGLTIYGRSEVVDGEIKSVGEGWAVVRLADLTWGKDPNSSTQKTYFVTRSINTAYVVSSRNEVPRFWCNKKQTQAYNDTWGTDTISQETSGAVWISTPPTITNETELAVWFVDNPTYLCYQLADPTQGNTIAVKTDNGTGIDGIMATFTSALPLRGVSDTVRDKLICTAEKKQVETVCREVDLGTQTITLRSTEQENYNSFKLQLTNIDSFVSNYQPPKLLSSKFEPVALEVDWQPNQMSIISSDTSSIVFTTSKSIATVEDFMTYVSGTHLIYVLATPTVTPLTSTEISAFRALRTFDGTTDIGITDDPEFVIGYLKNTDNGKATAAIQDDAQAQIDALEARVAALEDA